MNVTGTDFQIRCVRECEAILEGASGVRHSNFVRVTEEEDTYYKISISAGTHYLQVYIYSEEAGYRLDGTHWLGFDHHGYTSEDDLIHSFRDSLRGALLTLAT